MNCKKCKDKQYCWDCKEEQEKEEIEKTTFTKSLSDNPVTIKGDLLHFKGRTFTISKIEIRNPNKKITTKEGFIFYIREKNQGLVLIKIEVNKSKNGKPDFCESCYELLIGMKLPNELLKDPNW